MLTMFSPVQTQIDTYFPPSTHLYRRLKAYIRAMVGHDAHVLEVGCGREAPLLRRIAPKVAAAYGMDLMPLDAVGSGLDLRSMSVTDMRAFLNESFDLVYSRSVMEHVEEPARAFAEIHRVLRPGGHYIFLTPNKHDYASITARFVPNRLHGRIVNFLTGRAERDIFPTFYRANTKHDISQMAQEAGFTITSFDYLSQYPHYLSFSRPLFWVGCQYERMIARTNLLRGLRGWILCCLTKCGSRSDDRRGTR